ncbi:uncharacterized protein [Engystomops pustulosus]|uniref:uncharacterized protein n=1 Tax=Engystomops pustulosus TaxID=76066 RepID=UPI003AFA9AF9
MENLTKQERQALMGLRNNKNFLIKEADKGGNIVIWPVELYIKEAKRQLDNKDFYVQLPSDPTQVFKNKIDRTLKAALDCGIINKKENKFLTVDNPKIPTFYMLPKIHKSLQEPPGRPIVSGIGGLNEKLCSYVDFFLQPMVLKLPAYVRDTTHLIQQIENLTIPTNALLITLDVESLYTIIGHQGTTDEFQDFFRCLNSNPWKIKLTAHTSETSVEFLDLKIGKNGTRLVTSLFRKPTATNNLLSFASFHPKHLRTSIPVGQFLRVRRNCCDDMDFRTQAKDLTERFQARGYPKKVISKAFIRARDSDRKTLLEPQINRG